jgi:hypothetical protein
MHARVLPKTRKSRWDREPVNNRPGKPKIARVTPRDIELFKLLAKYPYLPADDIYAWLGSGHAAFKKRINLLSRRPNSFIDRPHQQRLADANYRPLVYELDERGRRTLTDLGLPYVAKKYHRNFAHELMACRIMVSFALGARAHNHVRLIEWPEIVPKLPKETLALEQPNHVPITIHMHGDQEKHNLVADWKPFGVERYAEGKFFYRFFPGIEADTGTEPLEAGTYRSDIHRKMLGYLEICNRRLYQSHFGFPLQGFFVPFITGSRSRMEHMMELLKKLTHGDGHPSFLFKTFPPLT